MPVSILNFLPSKYPVVISIKMCCYCQFLKGIYIALSLVQGGMLRISIRLWLCAVRSSKLHIFKQYCTGKKNQFLKSCGMDLTLNFGSWGILLQLVSTVTPPLQRRLQSRWKAAASTPASAALISWLPRQFLSWRHTYCTQRELASLICLLMVGFLQLFCKMTVVHELIEKCNL